MKTRLLFRAALMIALLTVGARIQIPLPYFDYYTLQFTFVLLAAVILPPRYAWGSVATYVLMGLIGIPIFAGGGGLGYVVRPSFGYLIGFIITAGVLAELKHRYKIHTLKGYFTLNTIGIVITYLFGLSDKIAILAWYLNQSVPLSDIFWVAFAFDIPADFIMIVILSAAEVPIVNALQSLNQRAAAH